MAVRSIAIGAARFELATFGPPDQRANQAAPRPAARQTVATRDPWGALGRIAGMRRLIPLTVLVAALLFPTPVGASSRGRPVALVTAETANEVLAVSLGKYGGHIIRRVHLADPLMIAAPEHGPAVVVSPSGTVTLLAWHSLRPIKVFHAFRMPEVAAIAPGGRLAYVTDNTTGKLSVIDLKRRRIVGRIFVGALAHHFGISPDGRRIWVALGETARTIVRVDSSNPRRPHVIGRFHPRSPAHDVGFEPDGQMVWVTSATGSDVRLYSLTGETAGGCGRRSWAAAPGVLRPPRPDHERIRLVAHRAVLAPALLLAARRSGAVRLVQSRYVRRLRRDDVALHRPGERVPSPRSPAPLDREGRAGGALRRDLPLAALAELEVAHGRTARDGQERRVSREETPPPLHDDELRRDRSDNPLRLVRASRGSVGGE